MSAASFLLVGLAIGIVVGWPLQHLDVKPVVRSILAMQLSLMFAASTCGLLWMTEAISDQGAAALSFGLSELMLILLPVAAVAALVHTILGRAAATASPLLVRNRAIVLGALGGLCGALLSGPFGNVQGFVR